MPHLNTAAPLLSEPTRSVSEADKFAQQNMQQALAEAKAKDFVERLQASQGGTVQGSHDMASAPSGMNDPAQQSENNAVSSIKLTDPNTAFLLEASNSKAEHVYATHFGALPYLIGQGKFIFANLAVASNSDLPGQMRAIVSQDVYGEQGRKVLIPKGSLLIGEYKSGLVNNQDRLFVVWTR